jgi:hypothetical protein
VANLLHMSEMEEHERGRRHGRHFLIPAGVLIGLGIGIIAGYLVAGLFIGLGLGFLASAFLPMAGDAPEGSQVSCCGRGGRWNFVVMGAFFVIVGVVLVLAPQNFWTYVWPYGIGAFFILIGLSFIVRMWKKTG